MESHFQCMTSFSDIWHQRTIYVTKLCIHETTIAVFRLELRIYETKQHIYRTRTLMYRFVLTCF